MQHFEALESEAGREEDREDLEEDSTCGLQCGDSLAIAVNHIGEEVSGVSKLLLRCLGAITRSR